jgi:hypothetical protein
LPTAKTSSVIALIAATISRRWSSKYSTFMKRLARREQETVGQPACFQVCRRKTIERPAFLVAD